MSGASTDASDANLPVVRSGPADLSPASRSADRREATVWLRFKSAPGTGLFRGETLRVIGPMNDIDGAEMRNPG